MFAIHHHRGGRLECIKSDRHTTRVLIILGAGGAVNATVTVVLRQVAGTSQLEDAKGEHVLARLCVSRAHGDGDPPEPWSAMFTKVAAVCGPSW